jgi:hypothetical protein
LEHWLWGKPVACHKDTLKSRIAQFWQGSEASCQQPCEWAMMTITLTPLTLSHNHHLSNSRFQTNILFACFWRHWGLN